MPSHRVAVAFLRVLPKHALSRRRGLVGGAATAGPLRGGRCAPSGGGRRRFQRGRAIRSRSFAAPAGLLHPRLRDGVAPDRHRPGRVCRAVRRRLGRAGHASRTARCCRSRAGRTRSRRCSATSTPRGVRGRRVRHVLPVAARLPPLPHAVRGARAARRYIAGSAVAGEPHRRRGRRRVCSRQNERLCAFMTVRRRCRGLSPGRRRRDDGRQGARHLRRPDHQRARRRAR